MVNKGNMQRHVYFYNGVMRIPFRLPVSDYDTSDGLRVSLREYRKYTAQYHMVNHSRWAEKRLIRQSLMTGGFVDRDGKVIPRHG